MSYYYLNQKKIVMYNFSNFELNIIEKSWKYFNKNIKSVKTVKRIRVCIYLRKSTEDIKDNSLKLQLNEINKFIDSINKTYSEDFFFYYEDEDIYAEDNVSGMQGRLRPEFDSMLKNIEANPGFYGVCIVYKLDRFSRKLEDTLKYTALLKSYKCVLKALDFEDNGDPTSDLLRNMLGVVAQYHAQNSALTSIKGTLKKVEEHKAVGLLPIGLIQEKVKLGDYNIKGASKITIDEDKAIIIKEIFNQYALGKSISDIENYLKEKQYKKYDGSYFSWQQIYYILRNKKYNGVYSYADPFRKHYRKYDNGVKKPDYYEMKDAFPKIIDDELFNKVQMMLDSKKGTHQLSGENTEYLLTGILYCSKCGKKIHGWSRSKYKGKKYYDYLCPTHKENKSYCPTKAINKDYLEKYILEMVVLLVNDLIKNNKVLINKSIERYFNKQEEDLNSINKEIKKKENMINKLIDRMLIDESRQSIYESKIESLEKDIGLLKQSLEKYNHFNNDSFYKSNLIDYEISYEDIIKYKGLNKVLVFLIIKKVIISNELIEIYINC